MTSKKLLIILALALTFGCSKKTNNSIVAPTNEKGQPVYQDKPYIQEYSVKYYLSEEQPEKQLFAISADRDNHIYILSENGVLVPDNGSLFYPGKLIKDLAYKPMMQKKIVAILNYQNHIVYLDNQQVFSNAWAGKIQIDHGLPNAKIFAAGNDFHFLVSDGHQLVYINQDGEKLWTSESEGVKQIKYQPDKDQFLLVSSDAVSVFSPENGIDVLYKGTDISCAATVQKTGDIVIGTSNGYLFLADKKLIQDLPCAEINDISEINGELWFATTWGAFKLNKDEKYSYYAGERWLPENNTITIQPGPENSVLILTEKGVGQIFFKEMTLEDKAMFYEKQVREKNIRYGFNCASTQLPNGYSSAIMGFQPSDNLWTGMYLASQMFRYKVTGEKDAKLNVLESLDAMERLHTVTGIKGLFARCFERDYKTENTKTEGWQQRELETGSPASLWLQCKDHPNWTFRSTASSDQTVGQIFALIAILELCDDEDIKSRALTMLDNLMGYIVDNNLYIIDVDGEPTMWGKWNPDYVNQFPVNVGDRKINSSNIIAFLQTAYKFTGKEKYKNKAFEMMDKCGYLENLMRPFAEIGPVKGDKLSEILSHEWNHSDDEMYFLAYWGLYPYAFSPELQVKFQEAIKDHWEIERPEKNALWNFTFAMTGAKEFDLDESIGFLQQYPMDLRNWGVHNSHRKDIEFIPENFRGQTSSELLPLSEIPLYRHNGQIFRLDSEGDGSSLISAGDVWLLPYWMGRYLEIISPPIPKS